MLIIKNGKVIDPVADRVYPADLYIEKDSMVKIVDHDKERAGRKKSGCGARGWIGRNG